jgi:multidrug efflux pump subunit AcrA (membrane-fusion protein)
LKLTMMKAEVGPYVSYFEVPAIVTDWPGRTHVAVTSPLTGVINSIHVSRGEMITSGTLLFTLRLTHQDLVKTQEEFLAALGQLDVEQREIERLESVASSGAIAGKRRLEREYERDLLKARLRAARQSLLLHGLNESQVESIERERELVREVKVVAPTLHADRSLHHDSLAPLQTRLQSPPEAAGTLPGTAGSLPTAAGTDARLASLMQPPPSHPEHLEAEFLVTELNGSRGEAVNAGQKIAQLSDYSTLLVEGSAFQQDSAALRQAVEKDLAIQAVIPMGDGRPHIIDGLKIVYLGNEVDRISRALPFYVSLDNETERTQTIDGQTYVSWRYKPGQRMTLRVPDHTLEEAIVVPRSAVVKEGPERYVFVENDDHFDRVPVHVLASDALDAAIANDGQLWPGQSIAVNGAHQLQMALQNRTGGAIDPHAGHNH